MIAPLPLKRKYTPMGIITPCAVCGDLTYVARPGKNAVYLRHLKRCAAPVLTKRAPVRRGTHILNYLCIRCGDNPTRRPNQFCIQCMHEVRRSRQCFDCKTPTAPYMTRCPQCHAKWLSQQEPAVQHKYAERAARHSHNPTPGTN